MAEKYKSILHELLEMYPQKDKDMIVESRGSHTVNSAINFLDMLYETYSKDEAEDLHKRFVSAIKTRNPKRFLKGIENLKDKNDG